MNDYSISLSSFVQDMQFPSAVTQWDYIYEDHLTQEKVDINEKVVKDDQRS